MNDEEVRWVKRAIQDYRNNGSEFKNNLQPWERDKLIYDPIFIDAINDVEKKVMNNAKTFDVDEAKRLWQSYFDDWDKYREKLWDIKYRNVPDNGVYTDEGELYNRTCSGIAWTIYNALRKYEYEHR